MTEKDILIEEFRALRKEIDSRLKILHYLILLASIFWLILIIVGVFINQIYSTNILYDFFLLIPLIFTGLTLNYQDNQRTLEATARYLEYNLKPKLQKIWGKDILEWERWYASQKKKYQFSSIYKLFALLTPLFIPIILLIFATLNRFQISLAITDTLLLIIIIVNFRYKLFRIK